MESAHGSEEYAFIADLYDHVVPYRERPDIVFFVEAAKESGGPVLGDVRRGCTENCEVIL